MYFFFERERENTYISWQLQTLRQKDLKGRQSLFRQLLCKNTKYIKLPKVRVHYKLYIKIKDGFIM